MLVQPLKSINRYSFILYFWCLLAIFSGCHTAKKIAKSPESHPPTSPAATDLTPDFLLSKLRENAIDYKTFSAKAKLNFSTPTESQKGITTFIRMQKDSAIWISIRPVLGIELVRVLITPDSVKMINFFKKTVTMAGADSLQQLLHIPYNFSSLQNLILGNPVVLSTPENIRTAGDTIAFSCVVDSLVSGYKLGTNDFLMQSNKLTIQQDTGAPRYSNQIFDAYQMVNDQHFASKRILDIHTPKATHVELSFSKVDINEPVAFPFPEPSGFSLN